MFRKKLLNISDNKFLAKYAIIIYTIILLILIPSVIAGNSLFIINAFKKTSDTQLQRQALIITELINATVINSEDDLTNLQDKLANVFNGPDEISSMDIMIPDGDKFVIIASGHEQNIGKTISSFNALLSWHDDIAIAHQTKPSSEDIRFNPELSDQRFWNVIAPLHNNDGEKIAMINLKMSLEIIDALHLKTLIVSAILMIGTLFIVILLLLANTQLFQYAILFKKLKEVDEMKDEFISMASHELRTPITVLKGYIEMFRDGNFGKLTDAGDKSLNIMRISVNRLGELIDDLLNVSRIEQGRMQIDIKEIDLNAIIIQSVDELTNSAAGKNLILKYEESKITGVFADPDRLKQVLINLIGNSIKYTKEGSITVKAAEEEKNVVKIRIKDTGIGVSATEREKLFEKFYRVKSEKTKGITGTGLGLWITKQIIELMGGEIFVDSIEGSGTEISFTLKKVKSQKK